jgi:hypothetical protein
MEVSRQIYLTIKRHFLLTEYKIVWASLSLFQRIYKILAGVRNQKGN